MSNEVTYAPDPRAKPLQSYPSRELGSFNLTGGGGGNGDGGDGEDAAALAGELTLRDGIAWEFFDDYEVGSKLVFDGGVGFADDGVGTGSAIIAATMVSGQAQRRLRIIQGEYGRKMPWGNDWGRIQIAVLLRIDRASTFTAGAPAYFGVCSGTTNMAAHANTANFVGLVSPADASAFAFSAGTRVNLFTVSPTWRFVSKRTAGPTDRTSGSGSAGTGMSASAGYLSGHFLEISRPTFAAAISSVNYNFGRRMTDTTRVEDSLAKTVLTDLLQSDIVTALASGNTGGVILGGSPNTLTYAFDESTGELDTINITWPETFGLEIAAIGVRKVY